MAPQPKLTIALCANFLPEALAVQEQGKLKDVEFISWSSTCDYPPKTWEELSRQLGLQDLEGPLIFIGSCFPKSFQPPTENQGPITLHHLESCFHLICGKAQVDNLMKEHAYLISPGWLLSWRKNIEKLGLDHEQARMLFKETTKRLVLLDTDISKDSQTLLEEFSNDIDLPYSKVSIGLDFITCVLENLVLDWKNNQLRSRLTSSQAQAANYALSLGLINDLTDNISVVAAIDGVLEIFRTLFAPETVRYHSYDNYIEQEQQHIPVNDALSEEEQIQLYKKNYLLHDSSEGFWLALQTHKLKIGYLEINRIALPAHLKQYLNLAIAIAPLCALAVSKVKIAQELKEEVVALVALSEELTDRNNELQEAQAQIKTLAGIIPICSYCKEIRDDKGYWNQLEQFIEANSEAQFSHGICDKCLEKELEKFKLMEK